MRIIGNILWLILGGLPVSLGYFIAGLLYCVTIIGIPFGYQLWKFGVFSLWPFGTEVVDGDNAGGCLSIFMNVLWILLGWWEIAATHLVFGLICCITIIGIPFGLQHFKMALLSLTPFGKTFRKDSRPPGQRDSAQTERPLPSAKPKKVSHPRSAGFRAG